MKSQLLLTLFCLLSLFAFAQNNSGEVMYEDKFNVHKSLPEGMEGFKDRIPEFRTSKKVLLFNGQEALYMNKKIEEGEEEAQEFRGEGRGMRMRFGRSGRNENEYYTNFSESKSIDRREFFGKEFLIEGERKTIKWKITADQKQVGSYLCQKAVFKDSTENLVVWFTPMIPVSSGPDNYFGLPGLILHVDIDDGSRTITALDIQLKELPEKTIVKTSKGKKISSEEFEILQEEKIKEREAEWGGRKSHWMRSRGR